MFDMLRPMLSPVPFNMFSQSLPETMVVFGTGKRGRHCRRRLERLGVHVTCWGDNNAQKHGTALDGLPVLPPERIMAEFGDVPVLICSWAVESINRQLLDLGFSSVYADDLDQRTDARVLTEHQADFEAVYAMLEDEPSRQIYLQAVAQRLYGQMFTYYSPYPLYAHPEVRVRPGDVVVDGGAASGDTLNLFARECGSDGAIHLFEPTQQSFEQLSQAIARCGLAHAQAVNKALWNEDGTIRFVEVTPNGHDNHVAMDSEPGVPVATERLDTYTAAQGLTRIDLIKLDIEGAELAALRGAEGVLRRFCPKLQICMYHKVEDLWELPLYIRSVVPEYKMYLGMHSCRILDLVLYCAV